MAIAGAVAAFFRQQAGVASVNFVGAATTDVGGLHTTYQVTAAADRYLDKTQPVTVKKNGVVQTTGYTIQYAGATVVFAAALLGTDVVTVDGYAQQVAQVGGAFNWKLDVDIATNDTTTFADGANGWKTYTTSLQGWNGSAEQYWANADDFNEITAAGGGSVIVVLYVDAAAGQLQRYEGYAQLKKDSIDAPVNAVVKETLNFEGDGPLYYRAG